MTAKLPDDYKFKFRDIALHLRHNGDEIPEFTIGASRALAGSARDAFDLGYLVTMRAFEEAADE